MAQPTAAVAGRCDVYVVPLLLFSLAIIGVSFLPRLPAPGYLWLALGGLLLPLLLRALLLRYFPLCILTRLMGSAWLRQCCYGGLGFALGALWAVHMGWRLLEQQLPAALAGETLAISGWVEGIPQRDAQKTRFVLRLVTEHSSAQALPERVLLSWYGRSSFSLPLAHNTAATEASEWLSPVIIPGQFLQLQVRLKRPRGFVNPGGFDYQAWLLRRGLGANGYVLAGEWQKAASPMPLQSRIDLWRYRLQQWVVAHSESPERGILVALLIGDSSLVAREQWLQVQQTGISHLIAISGLHVGFLAIVGYALGLLLGRCLAMLLRVGASTRELPAQRVAFASAFLFALVYSALAGFNIPTVRTLIMLAVFYVAAFFYRRARLSHSYVIALALVLIIQPLAAFDIGFWLSFIAVALLILVFSGRRAGQHLRHTTPSARLTHKAFAYLRYYGHSQWVMFIGLLVPLALLVNSTPLLSPLANFIAIPLVTFFVVPCVLLSVTVAPISDSLGALLLAMAAAAMEGLMAWLAALLKASAAWHNPLLVFSAPVAGLLLLAAGLLLMPRGIFPRAWGYGSLLLGAVFVWLPAPKPIALQVVVLDVGQGTAVLVSAGQRHLLFDTGPQFSENFDAGTGIVLPYLRAQGIRQLDALIISHWDNDHSGGYAGLVQALPVARHYWGEPLRSFSQYPETFPAGENCHSAAPWQWGEVRFRFLPRELPANANANQQSCVLLISWAEQHILLPGDLDSSGEWQLLRGQQLPAKLTLLVAAHHGSRSSSNAAFAAYSQPQWVVYSAGFGNRYQHPHPQVQARFAAQGSHQLNTAEVGAVIFRWHSDGRFTQQTARQHWRRYWYE